MDTRSTLEKHAVGRLIELVRKSGGEADHQPRRDPPACFRCVIDGEQYHVTVQSLHDFG